jgi:hypothetical protein
MLSSLLATAGLFLSTQSGAANSPNASAVEFDGSGGTLKAEFWGTDIPSGYRGMPQLGAPLSPDGEFPGFIQYNRWDSTISVHTTISLQQSNVNYIRSIGELYILQRPERLVYFPNSAPEDSIFLVSEGNGSDGSGDIFALTEGDVYSVFPQRKPSKVLLGDSGRFAILLYRTPIGTRAVRWDLVGQRATDMRDYDWSLSRDVDLAVSDDADRLIVSFPDRLVMFYLTSDEEPATSLTTTEIGRQFDEPQLFEDFALIQNSQYHFDGQRFYNGDPVVYECGLHSLRVDDGVVQVSDGERTISFDQDNSEEIIALIESFRHFNTDQARVLTRSWPSCTFAVNYNRSLSIGGSTGSIGIVRVSAIFN